MDRLTNGRSARRVPELVSHWSESTPQASALSDAEYSLTFRELDQAAQSAARLLAERGVQAGDRVLSVAENDVWTVVFMLGAQRLGAWPAIVNARVGAAEVAALRARVEPRLALYSIGASPAALDLAAREVTVDCGREFPGVRASTTDTTAIPEVCAIGGDEEVGLLLFTSGTIGTPKAVMLGHCGLVALGRVLASSRRSEPADVLHGMAPLSHIMGIANLMVTLWGGATLALMGRLDLDELVEALASGGRTHLSAVPTVYARLCDYITANDIDLSRHRVRYLSAGGAPLDAGVKARVEQLFGVRLVNGYGMTECAPGCRSRADVDTPAESIGWPEEGVEARIVTRDAPTATEAADVAAEETGELWLRSPSRMLGYYRDPAATAAALRPGGWLATGDLARWRPDGSIALVGRCKEMIIRAGFNVYPAEVEAAINRQPGVLQSGVVGRKRADGDEEVVAFVQLRVDASLEVATLRAGLRTQLAPYKVPTQIVVVEQLPLGASGKIHKAALMEQAARLPS